MGFTWIATQDGLNLFDGKSFTKYTNNNEKQKKISGSDVRCITVDSLHHLVWVLNAELIINAVNYETGEVVKTIPGSRTNNDDWSVSMALSNNLLWLGCMDGLKIYNIDKEKWEAAPEIPFKKNKNHDLFSVRTIYIDKNENIWAFVNHYGIIEINSKSKAIVKTIYNNELVAERWASELNFTSAINVSSNKLLIGTSSGLRLIDYSSRKTKINTPVKSLLKPFTNVKIEALAKFFNIVYIASNAGLYKLNENLSECIKIKESNTNDGESWLRAINTLYVDRLGDVWIGCKQGMAFLSPIQSGFKSFNNKTYNQSGLTHVYNLLPAPKGAIIIGQEKSLIRYDSITNKFSSINNFKSFNFSFSDFNNHTVVSADNGLFVLFNNQLVSIATIYPELKPVADCTINSCNNIGDSLYVIGSDNNRGIFLWNYKKRKLKVIDNESNPVKLSSNSIKRVFQDSKGRLWVLSNFGIDIIEKNFLKVNYINLKNPVDGNPFKPYFDVCELGGKFWITCYSYGIAQVDFNGKLLKILSAKNGLCNDGVYNIFKTDNKNLIVTSNNGLSVFNTENSTFTNYYEQDGLHSNAFEENCGIEKNGKIYVGGLGGFTIIDPKLLFINKIAPKLYFSDIGINTKSNYINVKNLNIKSLTIPNDVLQTTISFSGLNYTNPNRVTYKYKIQELNNQWIDLGTQNFLNIIGINPGTYTLLVKSANENGIWNKNPIKLNLLFLPKWYQTWWFEFLIIITACGILYTIYWYRINQLKVQQQIRRDIANDLHDDLGGNLNSIKMFTHMAIEKPQNGSYLNEIENLITHTTTGLRDMLWVLEDSRDDINGLLDRIKKFATPIAQANQINFEHEVEQGLGSQNISKTEKRNLLLISKEVINNCFKYASCKNIKIVFRQNGNKISLSITDDGIGFNSNGKSEGYGLSNIQYRAKQINYKYQIISSPGNGTTVIIEKK